MNPIDFLSIKQDYYFLPLGPSFRLTVIMDWYSLWLCGSCEGPTRTTSSPPWDGLGRALLVFLVINVFENLCGVCICAHVCFCVCMYICICVHMHVCMCVIVYMHMCVHPLCVCMCMCTHTSACTNICSWFCSLGSGILSAGYSFLSISNLASGGLLFS